MLKVYLPLVGLVWLLAACASGSPASREVTREVTRNVRTTVIVIATQTPADTPSSKPSISTPSSGSSYSTPSSVKPGVGSDVTLGIVGLGVTKADFDELTKLALANDKVGGQRLIDSGRVLVIQSGTKAKIIEMDFTSYRVRIMTGPYAGRDGWVVREAVQ